MSVAFMSGKQVHGDDSEYDPLGKTVYNGGTDGVKSTQWHFQEAINEMDEEQLEFVTDALKAGRGASLMKQAIAFQCFIDSISVHWEKMQQAHEENVAEVCDWLSS